MTIFRKNERADFQDQFCNRCEHDSTQRCSINKILDQFDDGRELIGQVILDMLMTTNIKDGKKEVAALCLKKNGTYPIFKHRQAEDEHCNPPIFGKRRFKNE